MSRPRISKAQVAHDQGARLRIVAKDPRIDIWVDMGDGPATITGGLGGWRTVERVDDIALTDWAGQGPLTQDVPVMLDGFAKSEPVEQELKTLFKLGRDVTGNESTPPVFEIAGPIHFPEAHWVLPEGGIELDDASTIRADNGLLLRQALTLHLLEFVDPDEVKLRRKRRHKQRMGISDNQALTDTTHPGDTLAKIAHREKGSWEKWKEIGQRNGINDPNRVLPKGTELRL